MIRTLVTVTLLVAAGIAQAQPYPTKPIRVIVPFPPGGANDVVVRPLAQLLGQSLGTQLIVDNRGGGGTLIGAGIAAKAPADGYTLLVCGIGTHVAGPQLRHASYDPFKDFEPITLLASAPMLLVTYNAFASASLAELVAAAKANPGKFSYASGGAGTPSHLSTEIFTSLSGIKLLHVPYKGGGDAMTDQVAGRVDLKFDAAPSALPPVKAGRLKALAISLGARWPDLPNVPTFRESGWPEYKTATWYALCAPAKTPKAIIDRIYRETRIALASSDYRERLRQVGASPVGSSPQELAAFIRSENETYGKVIKALGLSVN